MRYGAVLQCSLWGWRSWSYQADVRRTPPRKLPLVAEEPLVPVEPQEGEPAHREAQQVRPENASSHRERAMGTGADRTLLAGRG